jgi:hypothetical protein
MRESRGAMLLVGVAWADERPGREDWRRELAEKVSLVVLWDE